MLRQRTATSSTGGSSASSTHGRAISQSHSLLNHRSPSPPPPQPNVPLLANEPFDTFWAPPVPKLWFWAIEGDEAKEGPAYNYARFFTQAQVQRQLLHGFTSTLRNLNAGYGAPSITVGGSPFEATPRLPLEEAMSGTTEQMAAFTHLPPESERDVPYLMAAYMGWRQMDSEMVLHMLVSLISGLIVLWCAIGAG